MSAVLQSPDGIPTKPPRKRRWLRWRIVIPLVLFGGGFAGLQFYRASILAQVPDIGHPFPIHSLFQSVAEEELALPIFERAGDLLVEVQEGEYEAYWKERDRGWSPDAQLLESRLIDNRDAMELWREGTEKSEYLRLSEWIESADLFTLINEMQEFVRLADLLVEKSLRCDQPQEAISWLRAMCRTSHLVRRNTGQTDRLIGIAFFAVTGESILKWSRHPKLSEHDLLEFLEILDESRSLQSPLSTSVKVEYFFAEQQYRSWNYAEHEQTYRAIGAEPMFAGRLHVFMQCEPEFTRRLLGYVAANHLLFIDRDRRDRPVMIDGDLFDEAGTGIVPPYGIPASQLWDVLAQSRFLRVKESSRLTATLDAHDRDEAMYGCLRVVLAAEAYFRRYGEFPIDAQQLVPDFLEALPDDLYSPTPAPVLYRRNGEFAVVYSRFTNGVDDGGSTVTYDEAGRLGRPPIPPDYGYRLVRELEPLLSAPRP